MYIYMKYVIIYLYYIQSYICITYTIHISIHFIFMNV